MTYLPPIAEQRFVLDHVVNIAQLAEAERFSHADSEMIDAILEGIGKLAAAEYGPTNRLGDTVMPRWSDGKVTMPDGFSRAYRACVEGGWNGIEGPTEFGGQDMPCVLGSVVLESLGTANMGLTLINMLTAGAVHALRAYGSPEQQAVWLPKLVSGEWNGTMNLTEPSAGSDVGALRTMAEPVTEGEHAGLWKLRGQKIFITFGEHDLTGNIVHLVLARTPGAPAGSRGISLFLVPKLRLDASGEPAIRNGVRCVGIEHKLGIHSSPTCVMAFGEEEDCLGELVGEIGGGMRAMFVMMNNARLNVGNQGIQIAEGATQKALAYACERVQSVRASAPAEGPVAIVEHPDVRRMLLRMKALTQGARALVYYAAGQIDRAELGDASCAARADVLIPLAKAWSTDIGCEVASLGIQVHGGMGFIEETGAAQYYRDARIAPIYEGTNGIQAADLVGRKLMLGGGAAMDDLVADIRKEAAARGETGLLELGDACAKVAGWMREAPVDDRLAGSVDFLAMLAAATAGWQMLCQLRAAKGLLERGEGDPAFLKSKVAAARFFLDRIVPEGLGRALGAMAGAAGLFAVTATELAAG